METKKSGIRLRHL